MPLVVDMLKNKEKSIYAPYFVEVLPNQMCSEGFV